MVEVVATIPIAVSKKSVAIMFTGSISYIYFWIVREVELFLKKKATRLRESFSFVCFTKRTGFFSVQRQNF